MTLREQILDLSRQHSIGELSPWFNDRLDEGIALGLFPSEEKLVEINDAIIAKARAYYDETPIKTVVLGMSGGVDSALTAAMLKKAGFRVIGVTMPINQVQAETDRGFEACEALGIEHRHIDLSALYEATVKTQFELDGGIHFDNQPASIRRGNVRARLRMITLYNLASMEGGMVASTDNLSELGAGFWTLHGDVGDFSPIQSLTKSWEVPYLARLNGVPESTVRAKPTDGLGISDGDEAQLGCSYLEWDIMVFALDAANVRNKNMGLPSEVRAVTVAEAVTRRMAATWFKRKNPLNVPHPLQDRYAMIDRLDNDLGVPPSFR